ncbi:MAG TPA: radical SAM protein, partial [Myxococcota bacterium]|nr:radical SAM protein [Myxococcota bacterium]
WLADGADLDVNGGEPLASPVFRDWIRALAARDQAPVVGLVTNGSLLTPEWLASLPRLPFRAITISLNAATPATYLAVNRGVPWTRIRANLDALLAARRDGRLAADITYSMVILKANLHEIVAFAELGLADGVAVRYLLPQRDRNAQSILTSAEAMAASRDGLRRAADRLRTRGLDRWADDAAVQADILDRRLAAGLLDPIGND